MYKATLWGICITLSTLSISLKQYPYVKADMTTTIKHKNKIADLALCSDGSKTLFRVDKSVMEDTSATFDFLALEEVDFLVFLDFTDDFCALLFFRGMIKYYQIMSKKIISALIAIGTVALIYYLYTLTVDIKNPTVTINSHSIFVEVAKTPHEKARGLSNRESLGPSMGMLFIFDGDDRPVFWMKDMSFSLDLIWINKFNRIVDIKENLLPCTQNRCTRYSARIPVKYVLEVNSGWVQKNDIKLGDEVVIKGLE